MAAAEQERRRLQASVTDHSRRLEEEQEKKQGITVQLEVLCAKLLNLESEWVQLGHSILPVPVQVIYVYIYICIHDNPLE